MAGENGTIWPGIATTTRAERRRELDGQRRRDVRASERDVEIPEVADPERKARMSADLLGFLRWYLYRLFPREFSQDHLTIIADLQDSIIHGESYVLIAPRGIGKSTIVLGAIIWALLYGHRRFIVLLCDNGNHSEDRLDSIRTIIETNERLYEDFPGPCACVRSLQGNWNRANGQTVAGARTHIRWGGKRILVFPTLEGELSSGASIATRSMKKSVRGIVYTTPDGEQLRPDFALIDDPIEPDDAASERIISKVEQKIRRDVMFLGEASKRIAGCLLTTVMAHDDIACRFLDAVRHPNWKRRKLQLMKSMPVNKALWDEYENLRARSKAELGNTSLCDAFYQANRAAMDEGASASWDACFDPEKGEVSATQHAMNIIFDEGLEAFNAECQNIPPDTTSDKMLVLDSYRVETACAELERGVVPNSALALLAGADVMKFGVSWVVVALSPGRIVQVIDYGVQEIDAPTGRIDPADRARLKALEDAIKGGLRRLRDKLADPYMREDGAPMCLNWGFVDVNWMTQSCVEFCCEPESAEVWHPAQGCGSGRNQKRYYAPRGAEVARDGNLYIRKDERQVRRFMLNSDAYKRIVHSGFLLEPATSGSISLFQPHHRKDHHAFARHITAEMEVEKPGGKLVWEKVRGRSDNHYFDALYNAVAGVSVMEYRLPSIGLAGMSPEAAAAQPRGFVARKKRRISYAEIH